MLSSKKSSASLPAETLFRDSGSPDPSWVGTSRSPSFVSSSSDASTVEHGRYESAAPLWKSLFGRRSRSIPDVYSPYRLKDSAAAPDDGQLRMLSRDGRSLTDTDLSTGSTLQRKPRSSILVKGRRSRWHSGKLSMSSLNSSNNDPRRAEELRRFSGQASSRSSDQFQRPRISEPFDFRHVAHTSSKQVSKSKDAGSQQAADGLEIVQAKLASENPPTQTKSPDQMHLPSEHANSLVLDHVPTALSMTSESSPRGPSRVSRNGPIPFHKTFRRDDYASTDEGTGSPSTTSRPRIVVPPPRTSSRTALTRAKTPIWTSTVESPTLANYGFDDPSLMGQDGEGLPLQMELPMTDTSELEAWHMAESQTPHAITTSDDQGWSLRSPAFSRAGTELPDVPEEDEGYFSPRFEACDHVAETTALDMMEEVPFSPFLNGSSHTRKSSAATSVGTPSVNGCWDDAIDYCYDHAAEADCEYEWDRHSYKRSSSVDPTARSGPASNAETNAKLRQVQVKHSVSASKPCLAVSTESGMLESEISPIATASTISEAVTPCHGLEQLGHRLQPPSPSVRNTSKASGLFVFDQSFFLPTDDESDSLHEVIHRAELKDDVQFSIGNDAGNYCESEAESSFVGNSLSKSSSQESMERAGSGCRSARRRVNSSVSTVPELVHSRTGSEELDATKVQLAQEKVSAQPCESGVSKHAHRSSNGDVVLDDSSRQHTTKKSPSCSNLQKAPSISGKVHRQRSQSEGMGRASSAATRKLDMRASRQNRLPGRVAYVLFPAA